MSVIEFMLLYQDVFHPMPVLTACSLLLVTREWVHDGTRLTSYVARTSTLLAAIALTTAGFAYVQFRTDIPIWAYRREGFWELDLAMSAVLVGVCATIWFLWRYFNWDERTRRATVLLSATAVPYAWISMHWNISGHVLFTLVPTLYLALVDRRYLPLLVIPLVMIPNRPMVSRHTLEQSFGSVALGVVCLVVVVKLHTLVVPTTRASTTP
jgi:uncharacterized membrane protein YidH (DUF202 family)